ncbi:MAG: glycosyltransferase family 39 protein [Chloroflexi bacterium]|nr:glycosyltransferase family 39 protein [Chloroflexota bacterium]
MFHSSRSPLGFFSALVIVAPIFLAAVAQYIRVYQPIWIGRGEPADRAAAILFGGALALWLVALVMNRAQIDTRLNESDSTPTPARPAPTRGVIVSVIALAFFTFVLSGDNTFTQENILVWVLTIVVFFYAFWEPEKSWSEWRAWLGQARGFAEGIRLSPRVLVFGAILLLGAFLMFYNLDAIPAEMTSDHAEKIFDVNDVLQGARPIFFGRNTGREPLQFYLVAAFVELTKRSLDFYALKWITALLGWLVIPGAYLLARELFDDEVALWTAAFVAISQWHIAISRMGLRYPLAPVFIAPMLYFLIRALKHQRRNDFLLAGLMLGLGLHGYSTFRVAIPLAIFLIAFVPIIARKIVLIDVKRFAINIGLMFALALIIFMPLARYSFDHPDLFWYRALTRVSGAERSLPSDLIGTLAENFWNAGLMFNWEGENAWPTSVPGDPALDYISGGLFLLGVAFALYRAIRFREWTYALVLLLVAALLLPSALSIAFPNENPSFVRAGGAIPVVFILPALAITYATRALRQSLPRVLVLIVVIIFFGLALRANFLRYHRDYDLNYRRSSWNSSEVGAVMRAFAESVGAMDNVWIVAYPHWLDTRNVGINAGRIGWSNLVDKADQAAAHASISGNKLYLLSPQDRVNLTRLQEIFPEGQVRVLQSQSPNKDAILFFVPGANESLLPLVPK